MNTSRMSRWGPRLWQIKGARGGRCRRPRGRTVGVGVGLSRLSAAGPDSPSVSAAPAVSSSCLCPRTPCGPDGGRGEEAREEGVDVCVWKRDPWYAQGCG